MTSPFSRTVPTTVIRLTFHENVEKDVDCWMVDSQLNRQGAHSELSSSRIRRRTLTEAEHSATEALHHKKYPWNIRNTPGSLKILL